VVGTIDVVWMMIFSSFSLVLSSGEIFLCVKHSFLLVNKAEHHFLMYLTLNNNPLAIQPPTHPPTLASKGRKEDDPDGDFCLPRDVEKNLIIFIQIFPH
jgi:hypothetical protein